MYVVIKVDMKAELMVLIKAEVRDEKIFVGNW